MLKKVLRQVELTIITYFF